MREIELELDEIGEKLVVSRADLLFRSNSEGELIGINEPSEPCDDWAPVLHICCGSGLLVFRRSADIPEPWLDSLVRRIGSTHAGGDLSIDDLENVVRKSVLALHKAMQMECGPACFIPRRSTLVYDVVDVNHRNRAVLEESFGYTYQHIMDLQPCVAKVIDGKAVAICRTVRKSSIALEGGVDTIPEYQKRGFGIETVAAWVRRVWSEGLIPCYSTQWENKASLVLAGKIGAIQYATDIIVTPLNPHFIL